MYKRYTAKILLFSPGNNNDRNHQRGTHCRLRVDQLFIPASQNVMTQKVHQCLHCQQVPNTRETEISNSRQTINAHFFTIKSKYPIRIRFISTYRLCGNSSWGIIIRHTLAELVKNVARACENFPKHLHIVGFSRRKNDIVPPYCARGAAMGWAHSIMLRNIDSSRNWKTQKNAANLSSMGDIEKYFHFSDTAAAAK